MHQTSAGDIARFESGGNFNIQYVSNNKNFQFSQQGDNVRFYQQGVEVALFTTDGLYASKGLFVAAAVPASASAAGIAGEIRVGTGFIYACVAANTWQRIAIATW